MKLQTILMLLGLKLKWKARFDDAFRKELPLADRVVVIRTADGRRARSYLFRRGGFRARAGVHPEATAQLVWSDPAVAIRAMLSSNQLDTISAIGRGDLTIVGNLQDALWFGDVAQAR